MIPDDAQITAGVGTQSLFQGDGVSGPFQEEFLLIDGGGSQQCRLHAVTEPFRRIFRHIGNGLRRFGLPGLSLMFTVTDGEVEFLGQNLLELSIEDRARMGLFLGFQYPVEIPGVSMANFMKMAVNEQRKFRGEEPLTAGEFLRMMREKSAVVELDSKLTNRAVNEGFSGGEKKKNEIFQMAMLNPKLAVLDETDSGLDIDALRIVATGVTKLHTEENATVVITHYQRLLDYIVPDYVHVLYHGRIIYTGDKSLALKLEKEGYDWLINEYDK